MQVLVVHNSKTYPSNGNPKVGDLLVPPFLPGENASSIISDAILGLSVEVWVDYVKPSRTVTNIGFHLISVQVLINDLFVLLVVFLRKNY